jgi:hypothetical protein
MNHPQIVSGEWWSGEWENRNIALSEREPMNRMLIYRFAHGESERSLHSRAPLAT